MSAGNGKAHEAIEAFKALGNIKLAGRDKLGRSPAPRSNHRAEAESATHDPLAIALDLAASGLPMFPCNAHKKPAIAKDRGGNGFRDASTDPDRIRELWKLAGRNAQLIGVPTGAASGFDVLDIDPRHQGDAWEVENSDRIGETRMHATPSGGRHYLFRHADGVRNSASKRSLAPGVDVRGEGGYVCYPPSEGYSVIHDAEIADWPDWLLPLVLKAAEPPPRPAASTYATPAEISDKRIQGRIRAALDNVAASEGHKHNTLRDEGLIIGGLADRAGLSDSEGVQLLLAALPDTVKDWDNARRTAAWGLAEGRKRPIDLSDRDQFAGQRRQDPRRDTTRAGDGASRPSPKPEADPRPEPPPLDDDGFALDPELTASLLSAKALLAMNIPPPEPLLGSLVTKSTRAFLVGPTGLGKTMMGYSAAAGMASGRGFLHWRSARPCRVLVIDGEMPGDLVQARLLDALRRAGLEEPPEGLFFYSLDLIAAQLIKRYPRLGKNAPLCTDEGQLFVMALVEALKPDAVIFDNLMSLLGTAALEPEKWEATLPLVAALSANRIGQLWFDHTNKAGLQYGTGIKSWRFDTVGVMLPMEKAERRGDDIAFTLSFAEPGKARRRTPDNRADYERMVIRLRDDRWTSELADDDETVQHVKPSHRVFHDALINALAVASTQPGETTKDAWLAESLRQGLIEPPESGETGAAKRLRTLPIRRAQSGLIEARWIAVDGKRVIDLRHHYGA